MKYLTRIFATSFFVLLPLVAPAQAAILTVTTNQDTNDGVCDAHCSLREAVAAAQSGDTIIFDRNLRGATIQLVNTLVVDKPDLTIDAPNKRRITLRGSGFDRVVELVNENITLDGLIITNGRHGETGVGGGGIFTTAQFGIISNCIIAGNTSKGNGGGIAALTSGGLTRIYNSTIINNISEGNEGGGGIYVRSPHTLLIVYNSTIAGNTALAPTATGGIRMRINNTLFRNLTITGNRGGAVGGFAAPSGLDLQELILETIIAGNLGATPDIDANEALVRRSLIGIDTFGRYPDGVDGNIVGTPQAPVDARLASLADNGGNLPTLMLLPDSLARDKSSSPPGFVGAPNNNPPTDARGYERVVNNLLDYGAVEYGATFAVNIVTIKGRVTRNGGRAAANARVVMRDTETGEVRIAHTNPFGYYQFANVPVDKEYRLQAQTKQSFLFAPQTFVAEEQIEYADFAAQ